jgi:hypothetical protein
MTGAEDKDCRIRSVSRSLAPLLVPCVALLALAQCGDDTAAAPSQPDAVVVIDGVVLTQSDLLAHILREHEASAVGVPLERAVLELELTRLRLTVTDDEVAAEELDIVEQMSPGSTLEAVIEADLLTRALLRHRAWAAVGWDKAFVEEREYEKDKICVIWSKTWKAIHFDRYDILKRSEGASPPSGVLVEVRAKDGPGFRNITERQGLDSIAATLTKKQGRVLVEELIDSHLVERELTRTGVTVDHSEVREWVRSMKEQARTPFTWELSCTMKGTSPDAERVRWRKVQAWKRITGDREDPSAIDAFAEGNADLLAARLKYLKIPESLPAVDYSIPGYREWVVDQFETTRMKAWLARLRSTSRIEVR